MPKLDDYYAYRIITDENDNGSGEPVGLGSFIITILKVLVVLAIFGYIIT